MSVCSGLTLTESYTPLQVKNLGNRTVNTVFCCSIPFPASPSEGVLWEVGGAGTGSYVGVLSGGSWFRIRMGDGGVTDTAPSSQIDTDTSHIDIPVASLPFDGGLHDVAWEFNMDTFVIRFWIDGILIGTSDSPPAGGSGYTATVDPLNFGGGASGGYLTGSQQDAEPNGTQVAWPGGTTGASNLNVYSNQLSTWVPAPTGTVVKHFNGTTWDQGVLKYLTASGWLPVTVKTS